MNPRTLIATSLLAALAAPAMAHDSTPRIDAHQAHQQGRIQYGVASGALTGHEAQRLQHEQHAIHRAERYAKADGVVTRQEREHLRHMQYRASRHIVREMHDGQTQHGPARHGQMRYGQIRYGQTHGQSHGHGQPDRW